jgi:RNA polymerase sigma-70 factor (ECF subfamily)
MTPSDAHLLARALADDDRHAFAQLVRRHQSSVRGLLRKLVRSDPALADDLAQDTFIRAWKGLKTFRGGAQFSTWLYRIAWNTYLSDARCARHRMTVDVPEALRPETSSATDALERVITRADLERALEKLRPDERAALVLTYAHQVTHEEAAVILDCPLGTLKSNVLRAKTKLKHHLGENGEMPS